MVSVFKQIVMQFKSELDASHEHSDTQDTGHKAFGLTLRTLADTIPDLNLSPDTFAVDPIDPVSPPAQDRLETAYSELVETPDTVETVYRAVCGDELQQSHDQYFTPTPVASAMAGAVPDQAQTVLDPAVGTGRLLTACDVPRLYGIDIDPVMVDAARIRSQCDPAVNTSIEGRVRDFLEDGSVLSESPDAVICNPPYGRVTAETRGVISAFETEYNIRLQQLTNIYPLFLFKALDTVADSGRIVFVTPIEYLQTGYGTAVKQYLQTQSDIKGFVYLNWDDGVFDVLTTACVTILEKPSTDREQPVTSPVTFVESSSPDDLPTAINHVITDTSNTETDTIQPQHVPQQNLDPDDKWTRWFTAPSGAVTEYLSSTVPLEEVASVSRGLSTGYNDFFTLTQSQLDTWEIEQDYVVPIVGKARQVPGIEFTQSDWEHLRRNNTAVYLLYITEDNPDIDSELPVSEAVSDYIEYGESELEAHTRYVTSHRNPWYRSESRDPPPILATTFSRDNMRFVLNTARVRSLSAFHGVYPKVDSEQQVKALAAYLNSDTALELASIEKRRYADGLEKFEPSDLQKIPVIDVTRLKDGDITALCNTFDRISDAQHSQDTSQLKIAESRLDAVVQRLLEQRD